MNSIQLISKINSNIEDLAMLSQEVLKPNATLSNIEKEVIKRSCSDLYELILKLKVSIDIDENRNHLRENITQEIKKEENPIKDYLSTNIQDEITINELANEKANVMVEEVKEFVNEEEVFYEVKADDVTVIIEEEMIAEKNISKNEIEDNEIFSESIIVINEEIEAIDKIDLNKIEDIIIEPKAEIVNNKINNFAPNNTANTIVEPKEKATPFISVEKTVLPKTELSLNEKIAQKIDGFQFSEKVIEPKIDSLKTAISLNKKIAFVNDLFKENVVEYAKSIDKINNATDLNEAMYIWTELKISHKWDLENSLVKDLEKLIQRRFS